MKPFLDIVYTDSMIGIFVGMCMFAVLAIKDDTLVCQFDAYFNKGRLLIAHAMLESVFQQGYEKQGEVSVRREQRRGNSVRMFRLSIYRSFIKAM